MTSFGRGALAILLGVGMAGCEWEGGGSGGSGENWNTSAGYANFSGTYREPSGGFIVSLSVSSTTTNFVNSVDQIGTGNGTDQHFEGTLDHRPVARGSVSVIAALGSVSLSDPSGSGNLTGSGGSGSINYSTGFVSVNCSLAPGGGTPVRVSYSYPASFASGEDSGITSLNVQQEGNSLRIIDSNGKTYTGTLSGSRTGSGAKIEAAADGDTVTSQFEAGGQSASGRKVRLVGTFSASVSGTAPNAVLSNLRMAGTWIEEGGRSAGISASAD
jgi:hypothetical protein